MVLQAGTDDARDCEMDALDNAGDARPRAARMKTGMELLMEAVEAARHVPQTSSDLTLSLDLGFDGVDEALSNPFEEACIRDSDMSMHRDGDALHEHEHEQDRSTPTSLSAASVARSHSWRGTRDTPATSAASLSTSTSSALDAEPPVQPQAQKVKRAQIARSCSRCRSVSDSDAELRSMFSTTRVRTS